MNSNIKGLSTQEVNKSLELYGNNALAKENKKSFLKSFFENLFDPIIRILMIALVAQVVFSFGDINYFEIGGIVVAILLSTLVSTISEYRSEQAFDKINEDNLGCHVSVLRDGVIRKITPSDVVVGDVVYLSAGEKIHADGEIISGRITVDQSALNGESVEVVKQRGKDFGWDLSSSSKVFRGSIIIEGSGVMRVGRVGVHTFYGMVASDVQRETRESPLKLRLGRLATQISKIGYVMAAIVGIAYLFNTIVIKKSFDLTEIISFLGSGRNLINILIDAVTLMITVVVVAAPEGLPMMITVVLSSNMKKMLDDKIFVKKMIGIETAGSMNILFTDKTGTITEGKPSVEQIITVTADYSGISAIKKSGEIYDLLNISAKYNTDVSCSSAGVVGGNSTDRAIYHFFENEATPSCIVSQKTPFSSEKKYSSIRLNNGKTIIKGAAELIIASSKFAIGDGGQRVLFDKESMMQKYSLAASQGKRVVAVAIKEKEKDESLIFIAMLVLKDKIRRGVVSAVNEVKQAGIQIVMITGDSIETASAIAEECGIYNSDLGHIALSAGDLHKMTDNEIKAIIPKLRVVSRALPQDKMRLVRLSQEMDLVVGMTGDGINDAPSLKLADVGFSMGSGSEIAKSASDIVILDNSFTAISRTILYGRTIYKSIRKFIVFQLTMNLAACGVSLIGQFVGVETPITIIQMLWVNIIMDTLGGLAFAGEPPLKYYMREKPKRRDEQILSKEMINQIIFTGAYTLGLSIYFLTSPTIRMMYGGDAPTVEFYTAFYALFIFLGIINCLLARCSRLMLLSNLSKNKPFVFIMLLISCIQIFMIYYGGRTFRCVPLLPRELIFVILLSMTVIPYDMARRLIYKLK